MPNPSNQQSIQTHATPSGTVIPSSRWQVPEKQTPTDRRETARGDISLDVSPTPNSSLFPNMPVIHCYPQLHTVPWHSGQGFQSVHVPQVPKLSYKYGSLGLVGWAMRRMSSFVRKSVPGPCPKACSATWKCTGKTGGSDSEGQGPCLPLPIFRSKFPNYDSKYW